MVVWQYLSWVLILQLLVTGVGLAAERPRGSSRGTFGVLKQRHTLKQLRDQHVVKQQLDYSCGAAALATLMTYYFGEPTSEREILTLLAAQLSKDEMALKEKKGFSLLDLKRVAEKQGYQAAGFKLTAEQLQLLAAPVIVFILPQGYKHFAVLRGIDRGRVWLADPARGNLRMSLWRFLSEWQGIVFVLGKTGEENITTYPLALPRPDYVQPEQLGMDSMLDLGVFTIDLAIRSQLP